MAAAIETTRPAKPEARMQLRPRRVREAEDALKRAQAKLEAAEATVKTAAEHLETARRRSLEADLVTSETGTGAWAASQAQAALIAAEAERDRLREVVKLGDQKLAEARAKSPSDEVIAKWDAAIEEGIDGMLEHFESAERLAKIVHETVGKAFLEIGRPEGLKDLLQHLGVLEKEIRDARRVLSGGAFQPKRWRYQG